ncbi:MAG: hypothetical protein WCC66_14230 [Rhizobiaceae bacterium]
MIDWPLVINRNRDLLLQIVAALFAMARMSQGNAPATVPRHVYRAVLRVLRSAESAVRRLIIISARGLVLNAPAPRPIPAGLHLLPHGSASRAPAFVLIDPLKRFTQPRVTEDAVELPRISLPGVFDPLFLPPKPAPSIDDQIGAINLCHRLNALRRALDTLPAQARRLARWRARLAPKPGDNVPFRIGRRSPFRPGLPPGYRKRQSHQIDTILADCHYFALESCKPADTS